MKNLQSNRYLQVKAILCTYVITYTTYKCYCDIPVKLFIIIMCIHILISNSSPRALYER
jgi:formate/nitrite transporter FocA (FNT family)